MTASELLTHVSYDPKSGVFRWVKPGPKRVVGSVAGSLSQSTGYMVMAVNGVRMYQHRAAWMVSNGPIPQGAVIDHINGDRTDNRIINPRVGDRSLNLENQRVARTDSKSGLLGASRIRATGRYRADISVRGKRVLIGVYDTAEEAHAAYLRMKRVAHEGCSI